MADHKPDSKRRKRRLWRRDPNAAKFLNGELPQKESWVHVRNTFTDETQSEFFASEFDSLIKDPRVAELVVASNRIQLLTTPIIKNIRGLFNGQLVYLGTFSVEIQLPLMWLPRKLLLAHPIKFSIKCVDSGRYDGEMRHKYSYPHMSDRGGFCFGDRSGFIIELANSGEFFAFFTLVLEGLWQVNREHRDTVVKDFRKVIGGKIESTQTRLLLTHVGENVHVRYESNNHGTIWRASRPIR